MTAAQAVIVMIVFKKTVLRRVSSDAASSRRSSIDPALKINSVPFCASTGIDASTAG